MTPATASAAILGAAAALILGHATAQLTLSFAGRALPQGRVERLLLCFPGFAALAVSLMVGNIVFGGAVFGTPSVVPVVGAAVIVTWIRRCRPHVVMPRATRPAAAIAAACMVLFVVPAVAAGSSVRTGDPPWHLGWTEQLLGGEPIPDGPAPEFGRNAYPWGWHAVLATIVRVTPGSDPLVAHDTGHLLILLGIPLGAAALARRVSPRAGTFAAAAASLVGGFGWTAARGPAFATSPSSARFGADLVVASPNSVYELFPPALPREFGLILLAAAATAACASASRRDVVLTGACAGLVGIVSLPLFVTALVWITVAGIGRRWGGAGIGMAVGVATVIAGLWAGPVIASYVRYGGFVDITPRLGREWPVWVAASSWGILVPLAAAGAWSAWRTSGGRILVLLAGATVVVLGFAVARGVLGWTLAGNATLLHQGRVWPPAHLLGAALAGVGLVWVYDRLHRFGARFAAGGVAVALSLGLPSPVLAARALTEVAGGGGAGFAYGHGDLAPEGFITRAAAALTPDDVVDAPDDIGWLLWQTAGVALVRYDDPRLTRNDLRIRYRDLAIRWDAAVASDALEATHLVRPHSGSPSGGSVLVTGAWRGRSWELVRLRPRQH